jgi:hypothetical protein
VLGSASRTPQRRMWLKSSSRACSTTEGPAERSVFFLFVMHRPLLIGAGIHYLDVSHCSQTI